MFNHKRSSLHNDAAYARRMVRNIQAKYYDYKSFFLNEEAETDHKEIEGSP
jgi:hypothetical protein